MNKYWRKQSEEEMKSRIFKALENNINYDKHPILGVPASYLDEKVFNQDASFVKDAPFISTLIQNPNHIGCHTLGKSESFFQGTQTIEQELIELCAVDILKGEPNAQDGYVASGGTEANIQAIWIYRNYFCGQFSAKREEICILCSEDSHYSMDKAANLLAIDIFKVAVEQDTRTINKATIKEAILNAQQNGKKHFIVVSNMMTTMFGSIDPINLYIEALEELNCHFKIHIDGAYGGFYYPFSEQDNQLTFQNPHISSFTLDAHKMAQAPYGTGIFLIRKGYMENANTQEASYVEGEDYTLIGSRSGANAVAVWMILMKNGPFGWQEKIFILQKRTAWMCQQLEQLNIGYYRHPKSNIITIKSECIDEKTASKFGLVPDNHSAAQWFKIVIMEHVTIEKLMLLIEDIKKLTPELQ
ncbi:pyridoxal phosphate-dependent decarboxylase family protein [Aureispira anguillae]|uniref:Pyridoxal-dependent decarboxylase n=1 Tax=Aureispira anguillae TaxID=2864201 RepID=A0A915YDN1_9BACT|nr:pyridoxal-dependent decarboxylase [Aureispira anguillae]BDS11180.1 pyridoxal-dependent decarboxylase [Aureispira anguillae]